MAETAVMARFELCCAHWLPKVDSEHKCYRMHGHNYLVTITISGPVRKDGFVIDYAELQDVWDKQIHCKLDHRTLNYVDGLDNPTCELLAVWIMDHLNLNGDVTLEIWETAKFGVKYARRNNLQNKP